MEISKNIIAAYNRMLEAESNDAEFGTVATKRAVTRATNVMWKKIKAEYPDLDMKGKIAIQTKLLEMA